MFYEKLKDYRSNLGLTQEEFAEKVGISRGVLSMLEANKRAPSKKVLIALSKCSNKSMEYWYDENIEVSKNSTDMDALELLLDYMVDNDMVKPNEPTSDKDREYINRMIDQILKNKLSKKASD